MEFENQDIKCNTFHDTEAVIKKIETKIKEARSIKERQYCAEDILLEVKTLSLCSNYNTHNYDCRNCHSILHKYINEYASYSTSVYGREDKRQI